MKQPKVQCPECGSMQVECCSVEFFLYRCEDCGERFSQEDNIELQEKSSRYRTRPRRGYDDGE